MHELTHELADELVVDERGMLPKNDSVTFVGIFFVSFLLLLTIAVCAQLVALPWRSWLPGAEAQKSLVGGVRTSVYTFMSYLN
jgi:light-harvesting complex 1 beta chain